MPFNEGNFDGNKEQSGPNKAYYDILGVAEGASLDEIKKAYQRGAQTCHPDKLEFIAKEREQAGQKVDRDKLREELTEKFKKLQDVFEFLCDPVKKANYDEGLKIKKEAEQREQARKVAQEEAKRQAQQKAQEEAKQEGEGEKKRQGTVVQQESKKAKTSDEQKADREAQRQKVEDDVSQQEREAWRQANERPKVREEGDIFVGVRKDNREVLMDPKKEKVISKPFNEIIFENGLIKGKEDRRGKDFLHLIHPVTGRLITGKGKNNIDGVSGGFEKIIIKEIEVKTGIFKKRKSEEDETEKYIIGASYMKDDNKKDAELYELANYEVKLYKLTDYREDMANYREGK